MESGGLGAEEQEEEETQQGERADAAHCDAGSYSIARAADLEARGGAGSWERERPRRRRGGDW